MGMTKLILLVSCLLAVLGLAVQTDLGNGKLHVLQATQDAWLESNSRMGARRFLIAGKHPQFPKKRFLVQFENLPSDCRTIKWAKMYIYFSHAHKASWQSVRSAPYINRDLRAHQVKQSWSETTVTSIYRRHWTRWSQPYLALDGSDAASHTQDTVTIYTARPAGYVEFDVTGAVCNWRAGQPNHGLLVWAANENVEGRDLRFHSRENQHKPFIHVLCDYGISWIIPRTIPPFILPSNLPIIPNPIPIHRTLPPPTF